MGCKALRLLGILASITETLIRLFVFINSQVEFDFLNIERAFFVQKLTAHTNLYILEKKIISTDHNLNLSASELYLMGKMFLAKQFQNDSFKQ